MARIPFFELVRRLWGELAFRITQHLLLDNPTPATGRPGVFSNLYKYTDSGILATMPRPTPTLKPLTFLGSSRDDVRNMPEAVRHAIGVELMTVQLGGTPTDFKPIASVGTGAYEIRIRDVAGAFRTVYVTKFADSIYVLHAFRKKTQKTAKADLELARRRYKLIPGAKP